MSDQNEIQVRVLFGDKESLSLFLEPYEGDPKVVYSTTFLAVMVPFRTIEGALTLAKDADNDERLTVKAVFLEAGGITLEVI